MSQSRTDSTMHQRRNGGLDTRYKSSKQACAAGIVCRDGCCFRAIDGLVR